MFPRFVVYEQGQSYHLHCFDTHSVTEYSYTVRMSKTSLRRLVAVLVALVFAATGACTANSPDPEPSETTRAVVTRHTDGDTAWFQLDGGAEEKVRFIGIDTPESTNEHEPYGEEASAYTSRALPIGSVVWLETDAEIRDRYDRLLAYVWLKEPDTRSDAEIRERMLNAQLVLDGFAQTATYPPNVRYVDDFARYQTEARDANRGLWAP